MSLRFRAAAATDVGRVRDHNEDGYLVDESLGLVALADGMGGHRAGEVASAAALDALRIAFGAGSRIDEAVATANDIVYEQSIADQTLRGMGTTLTAGALGVDGTLLLGHVGDSRAYLLRDGRLERVTTDHSLVEELITAGEITAEEAETDPRRSMITRAIGLEPGVIVDLETIELRAGDRVVFCSDGLTDMLRESEIAEILHDERDADAATQRLIDAANEAGGTDNITVLIVDLEDVEGETTPTAGHDDEPDDTDDTDEPDDTDDTDDTDELDEPDDTNDTDDPEQPERRGLFRRKK